MPGSIPIRQIEPNIAQNQFFCWIKCAELPFLLQEAALLPDENGCAYVEIRSSVPYSMHSPIPFTWHSPSPRCHHLPYDAQRPIYTRLHDISFAPTPLCPCAPTDQIYLHYRLQMSTVLPVVSMRAYKTIILFSSADAMSQRDGGRRDGRVIERGDREEEWVGENGREG